MRTIAWASALGVALGCGASPPAPPRSAPPVADPAAAGGEDRREVRPPPLSPAPRARPTVADPAPPADDAAPGEQIVQASLEPLVAGVRAGAAFLVAVRLRVARGYRISWEFPGDVGQPTEISLRAPPGFRVGPARFPAPDRVELPGGLVAYAYRGDTAVFFEVTPPRSLGADDVHRLDMSGAWVACKRACVAERTQAFVELMTTTVDAPAEQARAELEPLLARVPDEQPGALELRWEVGPGEATLVATTPGARPRDFFPDGKARPAPLGVTLGEDSLRFRFAEAPRPGARLLRGVVVVSGPGGDRALTLVAPLPGEEAPGPAVEEPPRGRAKAR